MTRRQLDRYQTPAWMTRALVTHQEIGGRVLECCVGDGSLANVIAPYCDSLITNDIDPIVIADYHLDAAGDELWDAVGQIDFVITNPPFTMPTNLHIVQRAWEKADRGVIFLQRLSFKEPTKARGPWFLTHPITRELTLPRHSFTGDGKSDSVTCAWMMWLKESPTDRLPSMLSLYGAPSAFAHDPFSILGLQIHKEQL